MNDYIKCPPAPLLVRRNNLLLWQIKLLNLWPLKSLRLPWMQFFTNSCRFFLALFCAGFSGHLLPLILPVCMFCLSSCCTWLLAISPSCFHCFRELLYFLFCFVHCYMFSIWVLFLQSQHVSVFRLACWSSFTCSYMMSIVTFRPYCGLRSQGGLLIFCWEAERYF